MNGISTIDALKREQEGNMSGRSTRGFVIVGLVCLAGCGQKVDCEALCQKEAACAGEISIAQGSATPEQIAALSAEDRKTLSERQLKRCRPDCKSPTMPGSMHTKWSQCLQVSDCAAFAQCVYH